MAKFQDKTRRSKPKTYAFLCCFGFSGHFKAVKPGHDRKRKRLFSWMRIPAKTQPVTTRTITNITVLGETKADQSDQVTSRLAPATTYKPPEDRDLTGVAMPMAIHRAGAGEEKPEPEKHDSVAEKIILESCEHPGTPKKPTGQMRFSFTRKIGAIRYGQFGQRTSPTKKNPKPTNPTHAIAHSLSFPPPNPNSRNRVEDPSTDVPVSWSMARESNGEMGKKYGLVAGMSILVITLAIMLLWGRLCAILCTVAWFYIVTSFRSSLEESDKIGLINSSESDSCFEEYKKKFAILKGFLARDY